MRNYIRKTDRGTKSVELMQRAANLVVNENKSLRQVCRDFELSKTSLSRFIERMKNDPVNLRFGYGTPRQIFNTEQEARLTEYLRKLAQIFHGIGPKEVRRMAYDCAIKYKISIPETWHTNKMAGSDWMSAFLKRNTSLSIRKPEATSLSRATSFNKTNVQEFYTKLAEVMDRFKFTASFIWNADETGVSTVTKPSKIVAAKGKRNIGSITSGERGTNVTLLVAVSATGSSIPPMFIFPRKKFQHHFIRDGPTDCIGAGNSSGWITNDEFLIFIQHFIKHVRPSKETPVLLVLDNHSSHLSVPTLDLAKENGVVMLSFPPHTSHKSQPLDVSVYGPFKRYMSSTQDAWMRNNAGKTMTIYDIPGIVRTALRLALTPTNIIHGFEKTGIFPFNQDKFNDADFAPSYVTDRPMETCSNESQLSSTPLPTILSNPQLPPSFDPQPSSSFDAQGVFCPEIVRPLPKAGPRKSTINRKRRKTAILTDTPEKENLRKEQEITNKKKANSVNKKNQANKKVQQVKKAILKEVNSDSSSDDEYFCLVCCEKYSDSVPGEGWIQCNLCRQWAHEKCISNRGCIYLFVIIVIRETMSLIKIKYIYNKCYLSVNRL
ncbi:hypothetical protein K1T71_010097 [Dendrolimus kikuchii]|uniref:Uncharacterized protein n=1 Tax=Dendrolimus kikuchii TaxID=765133 RepID=A0ACC1CQU4_9NEOP|nr:hypothetical protein K1T71_010097 [Dendrolimus kikuchii]